MCNLTRNLSILFVVCCFCFLQGCASYRNPQKESEALRQTWLEITPLGSSFAQVESGLKQRHLGLRNKDDKLVEAWVWEVVDSL
jgi:hypothetical protein